MADEQKILGYLVAADFPSGNFFVHTRQGSFWIAKGDIIVVEKDGPQLLVKELRLRILESQ